MDQDQNQEENKFLKGISFGAGGLTITGAMLGAIFSPRYRWLIIITIAVILIVVLGLFLLIRLFIRSGKSKSFSKSISAFFTNINRQGMDENELVALEELQRKFNALITDLRAANGLPWYQRLLSKFGLVPSLKNIYEMPWYLIIGPSGAGKSWALKGAKKFTPLHSSDHSGPSVKGKGGTFLMDWWECEEAFVLDTAGGVVFPEEKALESPEWQLLLKLLKDCRPECPITGLFVAIPAELLLLEAKDLPEGWLTLEAYAEALRDQIRDRLQIYLGLRFPIYFLITKSDRIPGFREFADDAEAAGKLDTGEQQKDQMIGWSSPFKIGAKKSIGVGKVAVREAEDGFSPSAVVQYLGEVAEALKQRRLAQLENYSGAAPTGGDAAIQVQLRAVEMFGFPGAINALAPRLQTFMEAVFPPPPPSKPLPPPFVRGIYFTSAMREGEVLEFSPAGRKNLEKFFLPGVGDATKSFFLPHLFWQKAFLESGLVMPLKNARAYVKNRKNALIWTGIAASLILLLVIGLAGWRYYDTVYYEMNLWEEVKNQAVNPKNEFLLPIVERDGNGHYTNNITNIGTQGQLAREAQTKLKSSWLFAMGKLSGDRQQAQLRLFERGVVLPLAKLGKEKFLNDSKSLVNEGVPRDADISELLLRHQHALLGLLELELCPTNRPLKPKELQASESNFVNGLLFYLTPSTTNVESVVLRQAFLSTFGVASPTNWTWALMTARDPAGLSGLGDGLQAMNVLQSAQLKSFDDHRRKLDQELRSAQNTLSGERQFIEQLQSRGDLEALPERLESLKKNWEARLAALKGFEANSLKTAFFSFTNVVMSDLAAKDRGFEDEVRKVNGSIEETNNAALKPEVAVWLRDFANQNRRQDALSRVVGLAPKTLTDLDAVEIGLFGRKADASQDSSNTHADWLFEQRLETYQRLSGARPDQLRDMEIDEADVVGGLEKGNSDALKQALLKAGAAVPDGMGFATLSIGKGNRGQLSYSNVIGNYLKFLVVEEIKEEWEKRIEDNFQDVTRLSKEKLIESVLRKTEGYENELEKLKGAADQFNTIAKEVGLQIDAQSIIEKLAEIRNNVATEFENRLQQDCKPSLGFPFSLTGSVLSEKDVSAAYKKVIEWQTDYARLTSANKNLILRLKTGETDDDWIAADIEVYKNTFSLIYDLAQPRGLTQFRRYRVSFPGDKELTWFSQSNKARDATGKFRGWKFGSSNWSDPSAAVETALPVGEFDASESFNVTINTEIEGAGKSVELKGPALKDSWTVLALIKDMSARRREGAETWLVPFQLRYEGDNYTVYVLVQALQNTGG